MKKTLIVTLLVKAPLFFSVLLMAGCELPGSKQVRLNQYLPEKNFVSNASLGETKFEVHCMRCHGKGAQGSSTGPSLLDKIYLPDHHADQAFRWAVKDGVKQHHWNFGSMPPIPDASREDTADIIAYIRQIQN